MELERSDEVVLEKESRLAFENLLPAEWITRDVNPDYGIDKEAQIVERKKVTSKFLWFQIKATENAKQPHKSISYPMKTKHLKHYEGCPIPVVILLWVKLEGTFYYLFAQQYIREELSKEDPNWRKQKTKTIEFPTNSKLKNAEALKSVATDGYFYIIQREPTAKPGAGLAGAWLDGIPKSNDKILKERTLKALLYMRNEDYRSAIKEYESILRSVCKTPSTERMAILQNLGKAYYLLGENDEALANYGAVLDLVKEIDEKDASEGKAAVLGNIGLVYSDRGDLGSALKCHLDALKIDREIGYRQGEAVNLGNIGLIYQLKGDLDNALKHHQEALKIDREIGYRQGEADDLGNIGLICKDKGDLDNALKHFQKTLRIHRKIGYSQGEAADLGNIGIVYCGKGDLDKALKFYQDALKIDREIGYRQGEAADLGNIGLTYLAKHDLDNALKYVKDALAILDRFKLVHGRDVIQKAIDLITKNIGHKYLEFDVKRKKRKS